jgi:6-phosphogluconolactonase
MPNSIARMAFPAAVGWLLFAAMPFPANAADFWVYFGTYTSGASRGIYRSRLTGDGNLTTPQLAASVRNPSFLAGDSKHHFLYAISEVTDILGRHEGDVVAFVIDGKSGQLTKLNQQLSGGETLCHVQTDATGKTVLVSSYGGGNAAAFRVNADGRLGKVSSFIQHHGASINPRNQKGPHAHCIVADPSNHFALVCDLGLDKVLVYRLDEKTSTLGSNAVAFAAFTPGTGPRHLAFNPNGKFVYVISEMGCSITAFNFDRRNGMLTKIQSVSTLPQGMAANPAFTGAEVVVHPSGKFLYGSTRGLNLINVYAIAKKTGRLTPIESVPSGGKTPRSFNMDPTGRFLLAANQDSSNVTVFRINPSTGQLTATGWNVEIGNPCCVLFVPAK